MRKMRGSRGFTLTELLVVVVILGILAALLLPAIRSALNKARVAESTSNLRQIGAAFTMYALDNDGMIPAVTGAANTESWGAAPGSWGDPDPWWSQCLTRYAGGKDFPRRWEVPDKPFTDPIYRSLVGASSSPGWRGGYSMNQRLNLVRGDSAGGWNISSSTYVRYRLANVRGDSVLVMMGYWEGFIPANDGTVPNDRFSSTNTSTVPHGLRIGAGRNGLGGKSALYLFADGSVRNLQPVEAADYLRLR